MITQVDCISKCVVWKLTRRVILNSHFLLMLSNILVYMVRFVPMRLSSKILSPKWYINFFEEKLSFSSHHSTDRLYFLILKFYKVKENKKINGYLTNISKWLSHTLLLKFGIFVLNLYHFSIYVSFFCVETMLIFYASFPFFPMSLKERFNIFLKHTCLNKSTCRSHLP